MALRSSPGDSSALFNSLVVKDEPGSITPAFPLLFR
jgi:hypothetical protein